MLSVAALRVSVLSVAMLSVSMLSVSMLINSISPLNTVKKYFLGICLFICCFPAHKGTRPNGHTLTSDDSRACSVFTQLDRCWQSPFILSLSSNVMPGHSSALVFSLRHSDVPTTRGGKSFYWNSTFAPIFSKHRRSSDGTSCVLWYNR